jgi:hypothetical protein
MRLRGKLAFGVNRYARSRYHKYTGKKTSWGTSISKCGKVWLFFLRVAEKEIKSEYPKLTRCPACWNDVDIVG